MEAAMSFVMMIYIKTVLCSHHLSAKRDEGFGSSMKSTEQAETSVMVTAIKPGATAIDSIS